jgi:hypothetical protein
MKTKHTPGKWVVHSTGTLQHKFEVHPEMDVMGEYPIADIHGELEQAEANAHLIAAAPDLLETLEAVLKYEKRCADKGDPRIGNGILSIIRKAIKEAKGEK